VAQQDKEASLRRCFFALCGAGAKRARADFMSAQQEIEGEERAARAASLARLANVCRQIGGMMEAGVDILRVTRVLRSQTQDEDILRLCDRVDFDLKMGRAISYALANEPEMFSPFAVSLIRQGEERNTLPQAFSRLADFLDRERQEMLATPTSTSTSSSASDSNAPTLQVSTSGAQFPAAWPAQVLASSPPRDAAAEIAAREELQARLLKATSAVGAGLLAASALSEALAAVGLLPRGLQRPLARGLSAGVLAAASVAARNAERAATARRGEALASSSEKEFVAPSGEAARTQVLAPLDTANQFEQPAAETSQALPLVDMAGPVAGHDGHDEEVARGIYSGAPRDEGEEAPRVVRRPRYEEEFD
jgi:hypothetical protein